MKRFGWLAGVCAALTAAPGAADDIYARIIAAGDSLSVGTIDGGDAASAGFDIVLAERVREGARLFLYVDEDRIAQNPGFALAAALYDNYALFEDEEEVNTKAEAEETVAFLQHVLKSPEIAVAKAYLEERTGKTLDAGDMRDLVLTRWFRQFSQGRDPDLSGFEHIFVGEAQDGGAQGLHFWHRFWQLEEEDLAYVLRDKRRRAERDSASVTMSFEWAANDEGRKIWLEKPTGGFLVGLTPSALIAIGVVRATDSAEPPDTVTVDGHDLELELFTAPNGSSIRTLFTRYKGRG